MSTKEKLIERFRRLPNDFTFEETIRLFKAVGFEIYQKGKTSGSRVMFFNGEDSFDMHRPHPGSIVKRGTLVNIYDYLTSKKLL